MNTSWQMKKNWIKTFKEVEDIFKKNNVSSYGSEDFFNGKTLVEVALSKVGYFQHFGDNEELLNQLMGILDEHLMERTGV